MVDNSKDRVDILNVPATWEVLHKVGHVNLVFVVHEYPSQFPREPPVAAILGGTGVDGTTLGVDTVNGEVGAVCVSAASKLCNNCIPFVGDVVSDLHLFLLLQGPKPLSHPPPAHGALGVSPPVEPPQDTLVVEGVSADESPCEAVVLVTAEATG